MNGENPVKTILVLSANPKGTKPLRLNEEIREIEQGLQRAKKRDSFEFKLGQAVRDFDIHRSILDYEPQIIHFSGHGTGESGLVFEDNIGQQKLIDAEALAGLFELFAEQIDCVVLNACYSEIQAKAIAKHIDYVIGMSKEIGDAAAIKFAVGFYDALGAGKDFEFAYKLGCRVIRIAGIPEHLTPQLLRKQDFSEENIDTIPVATSSPQDAPKTTIISPSPTTATTPLVPRQEETSIAQYRQKVEEFASDGVISDIESHILNHLQRKLGLTDEQTNGVREEVLEPYEIYKQEFNKKLAEQGYPLRGKAQAELKKLQYYYKIKDEYVSLLNKKAEKQETEKLPQQKQENNLQRYEQELYNALKAGYPLDNYVRDGLKRFQQFLGLRDEDIALIEQRVLAPKQAEYERQQQESKKLSQEQGKNSANSILFDKARGDDLRLDLKLDFREAIFGGEKEIRISHLETCEVCEGTGAKSGNQTVTCITCNGSGQVDSVTKTPFGSFKQVVNCGTCKGTGKMIREIGEKCDSCDGSGQVDHVIKTPFGSFKKVSNCPTCKGTGKVIGEKCNSCDGKGRNQLTKKLKIKIPAGVDNGTRLRISEEGDAGQFGGSPGDLYVYLFVNKDKEFERDDINILSEITISYQQALSGCRLETNTVDGLVEMIIPPKTQPNTVMRLKNRGVPRLGNPISRGDHLITVIVKI